MTLLGYAHIPNSDGRHLHERSAIALSRAGIAAEPIYEDATCARRDKLPALKACLNALRAALVIWQLDRLGPLK
ncbi:hypothetical protein REMIM1_PE00129 (plasmid) [Rhizobium etli bv. mimosae str. Mim1]|nr:hypothetical protein REMIM1_PE00129 [Rhizobium etli bv. mimosae str. Mim1]